jgi:hypothetical protein
MPGLDQYPFVDALLDRRSRRFGKGMTLDGGPLQYASKLPPEPLTADEEAAIVFAGAGFTGHALAELPFSHGAKDDESGCGNIMSHLFGRTMISGDAVHASTLFVMNDEGTWMVRRPQDFSSAEVLELIALGRARRFLDFYHAARVKVASTRAAVPRQVPDVPAFNKWSVNLPGMSYFLPVNDLTGFYINVLLTMFDEEFGFYVVDDTKRFGAAGIGKYRQSKGGHLRDDEIVRTISITILEGWVHEFACIEQGAAIQNMALMTQALGLGGFPHFAHHPWSWPQALGFRMGGDKFSRTIGASWLMKTLIRAMKRDWTMPVALGLERDGNVLLKPFCPPYYPDMRSAVEAYVEAKYGAQGSLRDPIAGGMWKSPREIEKGIPRTSRKAIETTVAYCTYLFERFGRFPATNGPFRTVTAFEAYHLDPEFYDEYYEPGALSPTQLNHTH